jgi:2,4-dienoyl-CoA reductase-like NADH-dependent reductase (Old Yellow Enzyme family)
MEMYPVLFLVYGGGMKYGRVIRADGFKTPEVMDGIIRRGEGDMIGLVRQLISDPDYPNKLRENRIGEIDWCTYCNKCVALVSVRPTDCYERKDFRDSPLPPSDWGIRQ